jgi:hypothetical protein
MINALLTIYAQIGAAMGLEKDTMRDGGSELAGGGGNFTL